MRRRHLAIAAALSAGAALVAGCTSQNLSEREPTPRAAPSSGEEPCYVLADEPGLAAWEVNQALPIDSVDITSQEAERLIEPGGGSCGTEPAEFVVEPCVPVTGPYDDVEGVHLWHRAEAFFEREIGSGAQRILSVDVDGRTEDDEAFHWRVVAVEYADRAAAETSPAWTLIQGCDDVRRDELQTGNYSLSEGYEPFLAATTEESTVYIVETWQASEDGGGLDDTESGLPPAAAVHTLMGWLRDQMRHL